MNRKLKKEIDKKILEAIIENKDIWNPFSISKFSEIIRELHWNLFYDTEIDDGNFLMVYDGYNNLIMTVNITKGHIFYGDTVQYKTGDAGFRIRKSF